MGLERWDSERKRYVLYRSQDDHSRDARRFPFENIPKQVFLDTNVINLLVKYPSEIFEQQLISSMVQGLLAEDIEALMHIFYIGARANWSICASQKTLAELSRTRNELLRRDLLNYALEIISCGMIDEDRIFANGFGRRLVDTHFVDVLPDRADRELIGNAIAYGCDVFCTCDRATIVNLRAKLPQLPLHILTPAEWWAHIRPWAGLWC
ncbi:hypothetical protein AMC78_PD00836 (plasmid) [Rhizobium phaseoli]|uniref:hypothetical protein n=1 Tax=Rhizobium phaseoli TaxID=396 RepID=UPI0007EA221E|nr:hypothetical protein [Rhizobium phaseoli]ANM08340.1 hypothetical protein AMC78_PD00836 [Rhizobium phaseoli]